MMTMKITGERFLGMAVPVIAVVMPTLGFHRRIDKLLLMEGTLMLVLSRNVGQQVNIGNDVVITILEVKRKRARLGITGPPTLPIHRGEIYEQIEASALESCSAETFKDKD
jgi:carbon storage regulator